MENKVATFTRYSITKGEGRKIHSKLKKLRSQKKIINFLNKTESAPSLFWVIEVCEKICDMLGYALSITIEERRKK